MLMDIKFTDCNPEMFAMMSFVDAMVGNYNLISIDLSRNDLDEDAISAIIQRLYMNERLQKIVVSGNPIATGNYYE